MMSFNESEWPVVKLSIEPSGKAPKKYGEGVFRFSASLTLSVILPKRGWDLIKSSKNYVYLKPPSELLDKPYLIDIKIPTRQQAETLAKQLYAVGENWFGLIGEWPVSYRHERKRNVEKWSYASDRTYTIQQLDAGPPVSSLVIGEYGAWRAELRSTNGSFSYTESGKYGPRINSHEINLVEGKESEVLLTEYERSKAAREACVKYHGYSCVACGLNFESVYGEIGRGFIHVHHIVPLSERGGEYIVDPIHDLIPLCPNCHAVIHRRTPPMSILELRTLLSDRAVLDASP